MSFLFDFGLSQEDPLTEQTVLDIRPGERILSLASGGEVALSLLSLNENTRIKAVDISDAQIRLCRLKLTTAAVLGFPENGAFLGYSAMNEERRLQIYRDLIRRQLPVQDAEFWDRQLSYIGKGIIHAGRFEQYIRKMRGIAQLFIGRKNLEMLISCSSTSEQEEVFDRDIATRKSLRMLFKVAFHPSIYRKRGLQDQALIHAGKTTGERFYSKFRDFCTVNPASENYFLQFFLTGHCLDGTAYPPYLQSCNKNRLISNLPKMEFKTISFQEALREEEPGTFGRIHMSNLGDWMTKEEFMELLDLFCGYCTPGSRILYRYLQKNHFADILATHFPIDSQLSVLAEKKDRFPFYGILPVTLT